MIAPVRGRSTFDRFRTEGRRLRGSLVRVTYLDRRVAEDDAIELAFVLPRRFGTAVERNRSRRRVRSALREALRRRASLRAQSGDPAALSATMLVAPSRASLGAPFEALVGEFDRLLSSMEAA